MANKVLDPKSPEFSSAYIGKLISTLFYKTGDSGDLGEHLELTLRAVLSKLQQAETMSVIQSLCMVFAHLFNTRLGNIALLYQHLVTQSLMRLLSVVSTFFGSHA